MRCGGNYPPKYRGRYFYGDFVAHFVKTVRLDPPNRVLKDEQFDTPAGGPACFAFGPDRNVYVQDWGSATVFKYVYTP